jgi:hypothetical protein
MSNPICTECGQEVREGQSYEAKAIRERVDCPEPHMTDGPATFAFLGYDVKHLACTLYQIPLRSDIRLAYQGLGFPDSKAILREIVSTCNAYLKHIVYAPDKDYRHAYQERLYKDLSPLSNKHKQKILDMIDKKFHKESGYR